jgi:hypothetical protein
MRRDRTVAQSRKAFSRVGGSPATSAGSGMPQCTSAGLPGMVGHDSLALSHTVMTISQRTSSNAPMSFGFSELVSIPRRVSSAMAAGCTRSPGNVPALCASTRGSWRWRSIASAIWLRAEFLVQRKSTRSGASSFVSSAVHWLETGRVARTKALITLPSICATSSGSFRPACERKAAASSAR